MGSFLDKPKTEKTNESGQGNDLQYGLGAMQGWRIEMEDSHCSVIGLPKSGLERWSFFAVFDGHAGGTVSKFSSQELLHSILNADPELFTKLAELYSNNSAPQNPSSSSPSSSPKTSSSSNDNQSNDSNNNNSNDASNSTNKNKNSESASNSDGDSSNSTINTLKSNSSNNISNNPTTNNIYTPELDDRLKKAVCKGFLELDDKMRHMPEFDKGEDKSGSTAVACLISPSHVYLINCGDSRAIFVSDNQIVLGTNDHKPINPAERERIQNAGGSVMIQRVNGSLAVSRALGDYEYKCVEGRGPCEQLVSPEPEIYSRERNLEKDEFVVLACDGIWDVMTNEDLKEYIHSRLKVTHDLVKISNEVLDTCLNKGSRDNMSLVIVSFPGAPKVVQEEVEKDNTCNEKIENRIKELIEASSSKVEFSQVLHTISQEKWEEFPPGGGFYAKQTIIEEIFNRLSPRSNEDESINSSSNSLFNSPF